MYLTIRLDTVLMAVELPARIANLASSLANVHGDDFTLEKTQAQKSNYDEESRSSTNVYVRWSTKALEAFSAVSCTARLTILLR